MTIERVGATEILRPIEGRKDGALEHVRVPVYVFWCAHPIDADLGALAAAGAGCPACAVPIPFARRGGILASVAQTPNCGHVNDQCAACGAQLYFDSTSNTRRARLRWPACAAEIQE